MKNLILHFLLFTILLLSLASLFYLYGKHIWHPYYKKYSYKESQKQETPQKVTPCEECQLTHVGPLQPKIIERIVEKECPKLKAPPKERLTSKQKLNRHLADSGFVIYPENLTLIGLKHEQVLEVWTKKNNQYIHLISYPFTAFSGTLGPKFKEGDRQIPEGLYRISYLNPNSKYHLSMRVNYPNTFDKKMARAEKRTDLGGDIMIHGNNVTVGCIPIGDDKIEELYFLAEKVGIQNIKVILSPVDFREAEIHITDKKRYAFLSKLYKNIEEELKYYVEKNSN